MKPLTPRPPINRARKEAQAIRRKRIQTGLLVAVIAWAVFIVSKSRSEQVAGVCRSLAGGSFAKELDPKDQKPASWNLPPNITIANCPPWSNRRAVYREPTEEGETEPVMAFAAEARISVPRRALDDRLVLIRRSLGDKVSQDLRETGKVQYLQATRTSPGIEVGYEDDVPVQIALYNSDGEGIDGMRVCALAKEGDAESIVGVGIFRDTTYDTNQCLDLFGYAPEWLRRRSATVTEWLYLAATIVFPRPAGGEELVVNNLMTDLGGDYEQDFDQLWSEEQSIKFNSMSVDEK
ncbi:hypothetical protein C8F01DRAFT_1367448 [Mycena amicta]|nr:hypothetical protein C8F01DRAFT_1367448 [Mycena amicta]